MDQRKKKTQSEEMLKNMGGERLRRDKKKGLGRIPTGGEKRKKSSSGKKGRKIRKIGGQKKRKTKKGKRNCEKKNEFKKDQIRIGGKKN